MGEKIKFNLQIKMIIKAGVSQTGDSLCEKCKNP